MVELAGAADCDCETDAAAPSLPARCDSAGRSACAACESVLCTRRHRLCFIRSPIKFSFLQVRGGYEYE